MASLLLDSHVYIWLIGGSTELRAPVRAEIRNAHNQVFVSLASLWELAIKIQIGKLDRSYVSDPIGERLAEAHLDLLPVESEHVAKILGLKRSRQDPFDRLIAAQALVEGMTLVTRDRVFEAYDGLRILWA